MLRLESSLRCHAAPSHRDSIHRDAQHQLIAQKRLYVYLGQYMDGRMDSPARVLSGTPYKQILLFPASVFGPRSLFGHALPRPRILRPIRFKYPSFVTFDRGHVLEEVG
jgi:hypothetical protein